MSIGLLIAGAIVLSYLSYVFGFNVGALHTHAVWRQAFEQVAKTKVSDLYPPRPE